MKRCLNSRGNSERTLEMSGSSRSRKEAIHYVEAQY